MTGWLEWFSKEYEDPVTGLNPDPKDDMIFAQNKILCGIADALERIATKMEGSK